MLSLLHYQSKNFTLEVVTFFPASLHLQYLSVSICINKRGMMLALRWVAVSV